VSRVTPPARIRPALNSEARRAAEANPCRLSSPGDEIEGPPYECNLSSGLLAVPLHLRSPGSGAVRERGSAGGAVSIGLTAALSQAASLRVDGQRLTPSVLPHLLPFVQYCTATGTTQVRLNHLCEERSPETVSKGSKPAAARGVR